MGNYPLRKVAIISIAVVMILNGLKSIIFPPENRKVFWVDVLGLLMGAALLYEAYRRGYDSR